MTFLNGYRGQPGGQGGAIYLMPGSDLTSLKVNGCKFINNTAEQGGAIFIENGTGHEIINCEFINNKAINGGAGGAICLFTVNLTIENSNFTNNKGPQSGAIHAGHTNVSAPSGELKIIKCNFDNNSATASGEQSRGGAINSDIALTVINSTFKNSKAGRGGAIHSERDVNVKIMNSTFIKNEATINAGGAILVSKKNITIFGSTFINNTAKTSGGAICFLSVNDIVILSSNFINNSAGQGGAIYFQYTPKYLINNSKFTNNYANLGGAIYTYMQNNRPIYDHEISNSIFEGNYVYGSDSNSGYGGAILNFYGNGLKILNSTFNKNFGLNDSYGGAIANYRSNNVEIINCKFNTNYLNSENSAGGAIYNSGNNTTIIKSNFTNNNGKIAGGAIASEKGHNLTIMSCTFINNTAKSGRSIYIEDSDDFNISYSRLVNKNSNDYEVSAINSNGLADYNWWGDNNGQSHTNVELNNYFVMLLETNETNDKEKGDKVSFNYYFVLNETYDSTDAELYMPKFDAIIKYNDKIFKIADARFSNEYLIELTKGGENNISAFLDNEIQSIFFSTPFDPEEELNETENRTDNETNNTNKTNEKDNDKEKNNNNKNKNNNDGSDNNKIIDAPRKNNETNHALGSMKKTGTPIIMIIIVLLSSLGLVYRKK